MYNAFYNINAVVYFNECDTRTSTNAEKNDGLLQCVIKIQLKIRSNSTHDISYSAEINHIQPTSVLAARKSKVKFNFTK